MSGVRVLVGTRKGAFILTSDGNRKEWKVEGPHFAGWEIYHLKGSPLDPNRIYASQTSAWFGQIIQRSDDGGKSWQTPGTTPDELKGPDGMPKGDSNKFVYDGIPGTHMWYDGTQHPWEFKRVWHLEPALDNPDHVYAGVEDAALFESKDGGISWSELSGLRQHDPGRNGSPEPVACVCTRFCSTQKIETESSSPSPPPARFAPTTEARPGNRLIAACVRNTSRIRTRK